MEAAERARAEAGGALAEVTATAAKATARLRTAAEVRRGARGAVTS